MISLWIEGQPPRKSNSRRIVTNRRTWKPMLIKSKQALAWVKAAVAQIPPDVRNLKMGSAERPLAIIFMVYYETRRPDLSVELILDMLQYAGVISDDRHVYEYHAFKNFDPENPGVEICIEHQDDVEYVESEVFDGQRKSEHP